MAGRQRATRPRPVRARPAKRSLLRRGLSVSGRWPGAAEPAPRTTAAGRGRRTTAACRQPRRGSVASHRSTSSAEAGLRRQGVPRTRRRASEACLISSVREPGTYCWRIVGFTGTPSVLPAPAVADGTTVRPRGRWTPEEPDHARTGTWSHRGERRRRPTGPEPPGRPPPRRNAARSSPVAMERAESRVWRGVVASTGCPRRERRLRGDIHPAGKDPNRPSPDFVAWRRQSGHTRGVRQRGTRNHRLQGDTPGEPACRAPGGRG